MRRSQRFLSLSQRLSRPQVPRLTLQSLCRTYLDSPRISRLPPAQFQPRSRAPIARDRTLAQFTIDEQVSTAFVQIKDSETNKLGEPQSLHVLLRDIDRKTHVVNQLGQAEDREFAVVEVVEKEELRKRARTREEMVEETQKAQKSKKAKQIELNWAIAGNDLLLKMKQLQQFLEQGRKVEIMLAAKRRARKATLEEGDNVVKEIRKKLVEIGAKEVKPLEIKILGGNILGPAVMVVQKV